MKKRILLGIVAAFAFSAAYAQQAIDSPLSNKAPEAKDRQEARNSGATDQTKQVKAKEREGSKVSTSATAPATESTNRDQTAKAPRLENKTYNTMSPGERAARIEEIEAIILQNEGNPDFNRAVYQKRIDLLKEME